MSNDQLIGQLSPEDRSKILEVIASISGISEVILFGSRALGTASLGSDVDLAIRCLHGAAPSEVVRCLSVALNEETSLPYRFDVIALELLTHKDLIEHIIRFGKTFWIKI